MGVLVTRRLASWAVWVLVVGSLGGSLKVSHEVHGTNDRLRETIDCNTDRYAALVANLTIARAVTTRSDSAKGQVIAGIGNLAVHPATTPSARTRANGQFRDLFAQYVKAQAVLDAYRKANPYPDLAAPCTHKAR